MDKMAYGAFYFGVDGVYDYIFHMGKTKVEFIEQAVCSNNAS
jgi:hypothetical protein